MLDDGEIERRVRLIRPMEQHSVPLKMMAESHWVEADRERFRRGLAGGACGRARVLGKHDPHRGGLAAADLEAAAERVDAGLSAADRCRRAHYRPQGLGHLGRERPCSGAPELTPDAAFAALTEGRTVLDLAEGLQLRRVRVMGAYRIELSGFTDTMRDRLRTYGLFGEIISWKLRMFVPTDASGAEVLAKVLDRYPIERIAEREAA